VLPENLFSIPIALYLPKNHYLVNEVDTSVRLIHSTGLIDYWISKYVHLFYLNYQIVDNEPKKLTFTQLYGIFIIWIGGCLLSILLFVIEVLSHKFSCKIYCKIKFRLN
jgi:hypothetical protein